MQGGSILGSHLLQVELVVVMVHVLLVLFVPMIVILQMVTSTIGSGAVVVIMLLLMVVLMGNVHVYPGVGVADVSGFTDGVGTWWCWCV